MTFGISSKGEVAALDEAIGALGNEYSVTVFVCRNRRGCFQRIAPPRSPGNWEGQRRGTQITCQPVSAQTPASLFFSSAAFFSLFFLYNTNLQLMLSIWS